MKKATERELPDPLLQLLRAEGSDWFWWFGDHHSTAQAETFDGLFRRQLQALYRSSGFAVPGHLHQPIKAPLLDRRIQEPCDLISPRIDGLVSDYFEWLAAGSVDLQSGGAMHASGHELSALRFGYDERNFYLRLDFGSWQQELAAAGASLELRFSGPHPLQVLFSPVDKQLSITDGSGKPLVDAGNAA